MGERKYPLKPIDPIAARDLITQPRWSNKFIIADDGCWLWKKPGTSGYASISLHDKDIRAHRISWVAHHGIDVPLGLELDHLCRKRHCVNPEHLEAVLPLVNQIRGEGLISRHFTATHCPRGHELTDDNLVESEKKRGHKSCKKCARERAKELSRLVRRAARSLGMTKDAYIKKFGSGKEAAEKTLEMKGRESNRI